MEDKEEFKTEYALIDIANGHMQLIIDYIQLAKENFGDKLQLMVGNVANPYTYTELSNAGTQAVRCGIGNGGGCLTTQQTGIGYPMASLIHECYLQKEKLTNPAKIVADGGFKKYSDIIKSLGLGADYCMLGSIFNKALESAGDTYTANVKNDGWTELGEKVNQYDMITKDVFKAGAKFYKKFRGMSTKAVQKQLGNQEIKTAEGITKMQPVEYTLSGWVENFEHYLRTAMSYTGKHTLEEFIGKVDFNMITQNSFNRFNK